MIIDHASSPNGGCNVAINNLYYSVTRTWNPTELMDLALTEVALCYMPIRVMAGLLPSLQLGILLQTSVLQGAGLCRGCRL